MSMHTRRGTSAHTNKGIPNPRGTAHTRWGPKNKSKTTRRVVGERGHPSFTHLNSTPLSSTQRSAGATGCFLHISSDFSLHGFCDAQVPVNHAGPITPTYPHKTTKWRWLKRNSFSCQIQWPWFLVLTQRAPENLVNLAKRCSTCPKSNALLCFALVSELQGSPRHLSSVEAGRSARRCWCALVQNHSLLPSPDPNSSWRVRAYIPTNDLLCISLLGATTQPHTHTHTQEGSSRDLSESSK